MTHLQHLERCGEQEVQGDRQPWAYGDRYPRQYEKEKKENYYRVSVYNKMCSYLSGAKELLNGLETKFFAWPSFDKKKRHETML